MVPRLRIFLSSPGDVRQERLRAHLVIRKLARDYQRYLTIEPFLWEYEPQLASKHFQDAIDPPSSFDIVLLFVWSRLGTALPEETELREYRGIDGRAPVTGTEWEFEDALQANRARGGKGPPDLLVYRRMGGATAALEDAAKRDESIRQYDALEEFWRRWFTSDTQFLAGYTEYHEPEEFDRRLEADLSKLIQRHIKERHLDAAAAPLWLKGSPFRGLAAYDFDDAPVFFGRDGESREGLTRLAEAAGRGTAFLMVSGPSGSGKSSVARAGLLPALVATKAVAEVGLWRRVVMRPGDAGGDPVLALARALIAGDPAKGEGLAELAGAQMTAEELAAHFAAGGNPAFLFTRTLRDLADAERTKRGMLPHEQARLVLVVDQLEELFTRPEIAAEQRSLFAAAIAGLAGSGVVWVIATMRSDLRHRLDEVKELRDLAERGGAARLALAAPDAAQLFEIIRQPAQAAGLAFDTDSGSGLALDAMLAKEAAAEPGVLPLLSVMLDDLYDRDVAKGGSGGVLTVASYRALGGLRAAIAQRAESKLQSLHETDAAAADALPRVLRALVTAGAAGDAPAARPVPLATFAASSPEHRLVEALIAADARLLTVEDRGKGPEVRLAHEALIENWPRAKTIVGDSGNFIRVRDDIEAQRRKWEVAKRRREFLLASGLPLAEAEDLANKFGGELSPELRAFVKASRNRARRRQQLVATAAAFFFVFAVSATGAGIMAYRAQLEADTQRARAETNAADATAQKTLALNNQAAALAALGQAKVRDNAGDALRLALAAWPRNTANSIEVSRNAFRVLQDSVPQIFERKVVQSGHNSIELSRDHKLLLTYSADGTARTWDAATGAFKQLFDARAGRILNAHFSPDGRRFATTGFDGVARIWDTELGTELIELKGHTAELTNLTFSEDGALLLTTSFDHTARLWRASDGREIAVLEGHQDPVRQAIFSKDGNTAITVSGDACHSSEPSIGIWDVPTGRLRQIIRASHSAIWGVEAAPDGKSAAYSSYSCYSPTGNESNEERSDYTVRTFDMTSGRQLSEMKGHSDDIRSAKYSPDGELILTASDDGTVRLWKASTGKEKNRFYGEPTGSRFNGAEFSENGNRVIASDISSNTIKVWSVDGGTSLATLRGHTASVRRAIFLGSIIVSVADDGTLRYWDARSFMPSLVFQQDREVVGLAYSRDASKLLALSEDGPATLIDTATHKPIFQFEVDEIENAALSPTADRIVTCSQNGAANIWNGETGKLVTKIDNSNTRSSCVFGLSSDGKMIAKSNKDFGIDIYDSGAGELILSTPGFSSVIFDITFSPNGKTIAVALLDGTLGLYDTERRQGFSRLTGLGSMAKAVAFSPDSSKVMVASGLRGTRIWDVSSSSLLKVLHGHKGYMGNAEFSPDGKLVLTLAGDNTVRLFDATTGTPLVVMKPESLIRTAYFSPNGKEILGVLHYGQSRVWDTATGTTLYRLTRGMPLNVANISSRAFYMPSVVFTPDDKSITIAYTDGKVLSWELPINADDSIFDTACRLLGDTSLEGLVSEFELGSIAPICTGGEPMPDREVLLDPGINTLGASLPIYAVISAWNRLLGGRFDEVQDLLESVFRIGKRQEVIAATLVSAHSLLLSGKTNEALSMYKAGEGKLLWNNLKNEIITDDLYLDNWEQLALDDFEDFQTSGVIQPTMKELRDAYTERLGRYNAFRNKMIVADSRFNNEDYAAAATGYAEITNVLKACSNISDCQDADVHFLYSALFKLALCERELGKLEEAKITLKESVTIVENLAKRDSSDLVWKMDMMRGLIEQAKLDKPSSNILLHTADGIGAELVQYGQNGSDIPESRVTAMRESIKHLLEEAKSE